jgi:hypothetical protein
MTTLTRPDGSKTTSIQETVEIMLDCVCKEDSEEENSHKTPVKTIEEPIRTSDDVQFCREQIKQTIESSNYKKAHAIGGITGGIYLRTFNIFHRPLNAIYNLCLKQRVLSKNV